MTEPNFSIFEPFERITVLTPLGIRFWDLARDVQVSDGLIVAARPEGKSLSATPAFRTASGIYAFHGLPGLHDMEYPTGAPVLDSSPPRTSRFIIEVSDRQRRFLPAVFKVDVPYRGIFPTETVRNNPGSRLPGFYLFSAPTRPGTPSLAVVRTQLVDRFTLNAAAHAVLGVEVPGNKTWYGLADERGCAAVFFPYPTFTDVPGGSPPTSLPAEVGQQYWAVSIRVQYDSTTLKVPAGSKVPELASIFNQAPGLIWSTLAFQQGQPVTRLSAELIFGQELVVRTDKGPELLISRTASPP